MNWKRLNVARSNEASKNKSLYTEQIALPIYPIGARTPSLAVLALAIESQANVRQTKRRLREFGEKNHRGNRRRQTSRRWAPRQDQQISTSSARRRAEHGGFGQINENAKVGSATERLFVPSPKPKHFFRPLRVSWYDLVWCAFVFSADF